MIIYKVFVFLAKLKIIYNVTNAGITWTVNCNDPMVLFVI